MGDVPVLMLCNKADLPSRLDAALPEPTPDALHISAHDRTGLDELRAKILSLLVSGGVPSRNSVLLLDAWERDLLRRMSEALGRALEAMDTGATPDVVTEELRAALRTAGELQGIDLSESILAQIFSRFCVGK